MDAAKQHHLHQALHRSPLPAARICRRTRGWMLPSSAIPFESKRCTAAACFPSIATAQQQPRRALPPSSACQPQPLPCQALAVAAGEQRTALPTRIYHSASNDRLAVNCKSSGADWCILGRKPCIQLSRLALTNNLSFQRHLQASANPARHANDITLSLRAKILQLQSPRASHGAPMQPAAATSQIESRIIGRAPNAAPKQPRAESRSLPPSSGCKRTLRLRPLASQQGPCITR